MSFLDEFDQLLEDAGRGNSAQRKSKFGELATQLERQVDAVARKSMPDAERKLSVLSDAIDRLESARTAADAKEIDWRGVLADGGNAIGTGSDISTDRNRYPNKGNVRVPGKALDFFPKDAAQELFKAVKGRGTCEIEIKSGPADVTGLLPPELFPSVIGAVHEGRILDYIPTSSTGAPQVEYIQALSWSGSAATVAPGAPKPQISFNITEQTATVRKIAAYTSITREAMNDYVRLWEFMNTEMTRILFDAENQQLLYGDGTGTNILGFFATTGIQTRAVASGQLELDTINQAIADLRTGAALATCDLIVLHPNTWHAILQLKDSYNRYYITPDPTQAARDTLWNVPIVQTTVMTEGDALMMDTTKAGRVWIRDGLTVFVDGYSLATSNVTNLIIEERLGLAVERPSAVEQVTGL